MALPTEFSRKYARHRSVIESIVGYHSFDLAAVQAHCAEWPAGFVTRIVNELEKQGWLIREQGSDQARFQWNPGRGQFNIDRWLDEKIFGAQIKVAPADERPRERLLAYGAGRLRTSELLAILIRSGRPGESALMAGEKISRVFQHRLQELPAAARGELKSISPAVADAAFCQIMAGIELGRRVAAVCDRPIAFKIASSEQAKQFCRDHFARLAHSGKQEEFHIVTLDTKNQIIDTHQITVGTLDASLVHPREVFRAAIKDAASSILLLHNHPSGDPTPSAEDIQVTARLEESGKTLGIDVLDHIVLGRNSAISLREYQ